MAIVDIFTQFLGDWDYNCFEPLKGKSNSRPVESTERWSTVLDQNSNRRLDN